MAKAKFYVHSNSYKLQALLSDSHSTYDLSYTSPKNIFLQDKLLQNFNFSKNILLDVTEPYGFKQTNKTNRTSELRPFNFWT